MVEQRAGVIDPYNPEIHTDAARLIEPRFQTLTPDVASQRRGRLGVIPHSGTDWLFVRVDDFPLELSPLGQVNRTIAEAFYEPVPGSYTNIHTVFLVTDANEHHYIACDPQPVAKDEEVVPTAEFALVSRRFRYNPQAPILFTSSDGDRVKMALLNAMAPGLASDYYPKDPDAGEYKFFHEKPGTFDQDVVAVAVPEVEHVQLVDFPPAPRRYSFQ